MKNPIQKNNIFATPKSIEELENRASLYSSSERMIFVLGVMLALNFASEEFDKQI